MAGETVALARNARFAAPALVDGTMGIVVAPHGHLLLVLTVRVEDERITSYEVIADPARLRRLTLAAPDA